MIGVLTFHKVANYGAYYQALAQAKALEAKVIDASCASYLSHTSREQIFVDSRKSEMNLTTQTLVSSLQKDWIRFLNDISISTIVVGADEIWKTIDGKGYSPFLLEGFEGRKTASAVSANRLDYLSLSQEALQRVGEALSDFQLIGVRDQHTYDFLSHVQERTGIEIEKELVPDPTWSLDFSIKKKKSQKPKLGLSLITNLTPTHKAFYENLMGSFKNYEKEAVRVPSPLSDRNLLNLSPLEWVEWIGSLDFLITDSYHHAIFAMKLGIPFLAVEGKRLGKYQTKLEFLLQDFPYLYIDPVRIKESPPAKIQVVSYWNDKEIKKFALSQREKYTSFIKRIEDEV